MTFICKQCTNIFVPKFRTSKKRGIKFCSRNCFYASFKGNGNPRWSKNIEYRGIHNWVERELGKPLICTRCMKVGYGHNMHWANISGIYKKDIKDWLRLCAKCHRHYDLSKKILCQQ